MDKTGINYMGIADDAHLGGGQRYRDVWATVNRRTFHTLRQVGFDVDDARTQAIVCAAIYAALEYSRQTKATASPRDAIVVVG